MGHLAKAVMALILGAVAAAQTPAPPAAATFAAVSIKPDRDISGVRGLRTHPGGASGAASLLELIQWAYNVDATRVAGGPPWLDSTLFQIEARTAAAASYREQAIMLRPVLADRFGLQFRWSAATASGYILQVAPDGPKLHAPAPGERANWVEHDGATAIQILHHNETVADLTPELEWLVGHKPVVDQTGLTGAYSFTLICAPPFDFHRQGDAAALPAPAAPSLFTAVKEQLGLQLKSAQVPIRRFVILAVHRPTPN